MSNELRKATGLVQGIACLLGLDRGDDAGITRVAEEIAAAINAKELEAFEAVLCRQELPWWDNINVTAGGAGNRSIAEVFNESTDHLCVVDVAVAGSDGAAASIKWAKTGTQLTTDNGLVGNRDGRYPRGVIPFTRIRSQNGVALPAGVQNGEAWDQNVLTGEHSELPVKVLLPPGQGLCVYPALDNLNLRASFAGRTWRVANFRELNP